MGEAFQSALNVLLVEDDKDLAGFVKQGLEEESCIVTAVHDGGSGLRQAELHAFDIIVMDVMMPVLNGFEVTKRLRMQKVRTPILLLTARDAPEDIVKGLDAGADDYLTKPFEFEVLLARIRARTRGATGKNAGQMRFADLFLDVERREAVRAVLGCLSMAAAGVERSGGTSASAVSRWGSGACAGVELASRNRNLGCASAAVHRGERCGDVVSVGKQFAVHDDGIAATGQRRSERRRAGRR